jgi:hypothetical protein
MMDSLLDVCVREPMDPLYGTPLWTPSMDPLFTVVNSRFPSFRPLPPLVSDPTRLTHRVNHNDTLTSLLTHTQRRARGAGAGYPILGVGVGALGQQGLYRPRVASLTRPVQRRIFVLHGTCSIHRRRSVVRAGGVAQGPCKREGG